MRSWWLAERRARARPELLWCQEVAGEAYWKLHPIAFIGPGAIAPHDIEPFVASLPDGRKVRRRCCGYRPARLAWYEIPADPAAVAAP